MAQVSVSLIRLVNQGPVRDFEQKRSRVFGKRMKSKKIRGPYYQELLFEAISILLVVNYTCTISLTYKIATAKHVRNN